MACNERFDPADAGASEDSAKCGQPRLEERESRGSSRLAPSVRLGGSKRLLDGFLGDKKFAPIDDPKGRELPLADKTGDMRLSDPKADGRLACSEISLRHGSIKNPNRRQCNKIHLIFRLLSVTESREEKVTFSGHLKNSSSLNLGISPAFWVTSSPARPRMLSL